MYNNDCGKKKIRLFKFLTIKKVRNECFGLFICMTSLLNFRGYQFITFAVNIDNFDRVVFLQMLTQFSDIYIHASGIEVIIINPNSFQSKVTLQNFIGMRTKQAQQFGFLSGKLGILAINRQNLFLSIESKTANLINVTLLISLTTYTTQDSFNTES